MSVRQVSRRRLLRLGLAAAPALAAGLPPLAIAADVAYEWSNISSHLSSTQGRPTLRAVQFIGDEGWVATSSWAEWYHTTDGGATFQVQATSLPFTCLHMLTDLEGYAGVDGNAYQDGQVHHTTNGGADWVQVTGNIGGKVAAPSFPPGLATGFACGAGGKFADVSESAVVPFATGQTAGLLGLSFPMSGDEGWVVAESFMLHYKGGSWLDDQDLATGDYNAVCMVDNAYGWAVGADGLIAHTTDGKVWTKQTVPDAHNLYGVYFLSRSEGWAVGSSGTVLHTSNGGATWLLEAADLTDQILMAVFAVDSHTVYAVGFGGAVLKYGPDPTAGNHVYLPLSVRAKRA